MGGFAARLQRDQRPDPNRPDQGRADRLPDPRPAAAGRLPRRRRRRDPAADRRASRSSARCWCCGSCRASSTPRSSRSTSPPGSASASRSTTRCCWSRDIARRSAAAVRPGRRTAAPCRPPAAPRSSPGCTVAAAMAALIFMPQRFLYSMAVAGASVGGPLLGDRDPRRALAAGPARDPDRRALDPPRPGRLRRVRRLVPARPRGHAAPGRRRPRQLRPAAGLRGAAAVDDADRAQRRSGAAGQALLRRLQLRRSPLPARASPRRSRSTVDGQRRPGRSWPPSSAASKRSKGSSAAPPSRRAGGRRRLRQLRPRRPGPERRLPGHACKAIRDLTPPRRRPGPRLRQHRRLHRPEAEPDRTRAAGGRDHRADHPGASSSCSPARSCCR